MLTLNPVDTGNLTATVFLSGGNPGEVIDVWAAKTDLTAGYLPWSLVGTAVVDDDGLSSVGVAVNSRGLWVFLATQDSVPGPRAALARLLLLPDGLARLTRVRAAIRARIESLGLPFRMIAENITKDDAANLEYPCVILTSANVSETDEGGLNLTDDVGLPVLVTIADRQDMQDVAVMPDYESWREKIQDAFRNQPLDGVRENMICRIDYSAIIDPNAPQFQYVISEFTVRAVNRVHRL